MPRLRRVAADAAYDEDQRIAGVGVGYLDSPFAIIRSDVVPADSVAEAEIKAVINAFELMTAARVGPGAVVLNDSRDVVRILNAQMVNTHGVDPLTIALARALMESHGYEVQLAPRGRTKAAHRAARISLSAWRKGRAVAA